MSLGIEVRQAGRGFGLAAYYGHTGPSFGETEAEAIENLLRLLDERLGGAVGGELRKLRWTRGRIGESIVYLPSGMEVALGRAMEVSDPLNDRLRREKKP